ncbi:MAG: FAD-dependent oxidoreductase [Rhodobacterales bacterium]|nr:FAD-dependent oxidoreductase [Rhodobacterales bacterium]
MRAPEQAQRPLRVAIVGSGPSGFYAAGALLKRKDVTVEIDMFDRLPTPFGLVRGGVAPDHQKIKNVVRVYEKIATKTGFRCYGNVRIGEHLSVDTLRELYDMVVFAVGAESSRSLGIPGEDLQGVHPAREFVGWYNAHPDYRDQAFDLGSKSVLVVGVGNVALDVARILASSRNELRGTDIADYALDALGNRGITDIWILGRRGPVQAAFGTPELKELVNLEEAELVLEPNAHQLDEVSQRWFDDNADKRVRKNVTYLQEHAQVPSPNAGLRIHMWLCVSPVEFLGEDGQVTGVRIEENDLYAADDGSVRSRGNGMFHDVQAEMVFTSVGYRGIRIPGLPFDERSGVIPNERGRVEEDGTVVPGVYVVGWAKRGPSGVIGTNRADAQETVEQMFEDLPDLSASPVRTAEQAHTAISTAQSAYTDWDDWVQLDALERSKGAELGRVRLKFSRVDEMLRVLGKLAE